MSRYKINREIKTEDTFSMLAMYSDKIDRGVKLLNYAYSIDAPDIDSESIEYSTRTVIDHAELVIAFINEIRRHAELEEIE